MAIFKNILALIIGIIIGGTCNVLLLGLNGTLIALPPGADMSDMTMLSKSISLFEPINFIPPFLAHAVGTLVAAWIATRFAAIPNFRRSMIPGLLFLIGGIRMAMTLDAPLWFEVTDLILAYAPMAYIGYKLGLPARKPDDPFGTITSALSGPR